jgi:mycothiol synthase
VFSIAVRRQVSNSDVVEIDRFLDVAAAADGRRPLSDHLQLDLANGGAPGFAALIATAPSSEASSPTASPSTSSTASSTRSTTVAPGDEMVAYAQLSAGNDVRVLGLVVHPAHRDRTAAIGAALLAAARDVVAGDGGGTIVWWIAEPSATDIAVAADAGMHEQRRLLQMRRPLPTDRTVEISTRAFRPGDDDEAWLAVNNRAFAGHREQGGWTLETLRTRQAEAWFDPDGFRIHERDGRMAGFCWTKIHPAELGHEALGEIYVIAVDPDFHGLGLGTQLTLAGLDSLARRGIRRGMLFVDADNRAAVTTYERLGFTVHATDVAFDLEVAAAVDPGSGTPREGTQT